MLYEYLKYCYYNPNKNEIFLSNIGEYRDLTEDEIDDLF